jgi:hypothetical protein
LIGLLAFACEKGHPMPEGSKQAPTSAKASVEEPAVEVDVTEPGDNLEHKSSAGKGEPMDDVDDEAQLPNNAPSNDAPSDKTGEGDRSGVPEPPAADHTEDSDDGAEE